MEPKQGEEDVKIIEKKPKGPLKLQLESKQQDKPKKPAFGPINQGWGIIPKKENFGWGSAKKEAEENKMPATIELDIYNIFDDYEVLIKSSKSTHESPKWTSAFQVFSRKYIGSEKWRSKAEKYKEMVREWDSLPPVEKALYETIAFTENKRKFKYQ